MNETLLVLPVVFLGASMFLAMRAVKRGHKKSTALLFQFLSFIGVCALVLTLPTVAHAAAAGTTAAAATSAVSSNSGLGMLAAALSTGLAAIGSGIAVGATAPAAIGAITEDPKAFGKSLIFVALGEGIAIYGLLMSILILNKV